MTILLKKMYSMNSIFDLPAMSTDVQLYSLD